MQYLGNCRKKRNINSDKGKVLVNIPSTFGVQTDVLFFPFLHCKRDISMKLKPVKNTLTQVNNLVSEMAGSYIFGSWNISIFASIIWDIIPKYYQIIHIHFKNIHPECSFFTLFSINIYTTHSAVEMGFRN